MNRILVVCGHPNLAISYANKTILDLREAAPLELEVRRLDRLYGRQSVDVEAEQEALLSADLVLLQFPFYWYSVPALLKNWIDEVLTYGFAYGKTGDKLREKPLLASLTISSPEDCYKTLGYNNYTVEEFLCPLKQTALMAQMHWPDPVLSYEMLYIPGIAGSEEEIVSRARDHARCLIERLNRIEVAGFDIPLGSKLW
ncbi:MAG: NAD(P)H-dependent oxidoreductase [Kiloniellales bacterium]